jgi:heat shock protein HslJ
MRNDTGTVAAVRAVASVPFCLLLLLTAVACSPAPEQESSSDPEEPTKLADLTGREWVLAAFDRDDPAPAEPEITLVVEEQRFAGGSGCNRYSAGVEAGEAPGSLVLTAGAAATRMACPEPVMALESRYLRALGAVTGYSLAGDELTLTYETDGATAELLFRSR